MLWLRAALCRVPSLAACHDHCAIITCEGSGASIGSQQQPLRSRPHSFIVGIGPLPNPLTRSTCKRRGGGLSAQKHTSTASVAAQQNVAGAIAAIVSSASYNGSRLPRATTSSHQCRRLLLHRDILHVRSFERQECIVTHALTASRAHPRMLAQTSCHVHIALAH